MRYKLVNIVFLLLILTVSTNFAKGEIQEQDISIVQVVHNSSNILLTLDYDISAAPERGETESLVTLILLTLPEGDFLAPVSSLLFIRSNTGERLLYWILNDPFTSAELWQQGLENIHFQIDYNDLSIIFIESSVMEDPNVEIISFAKLMDIGNVTNPVLDFQPILERFRADYDSISGTDSSDETTTETTTSREGTETTTTTTIIPITPTTEVTGFPGFPIPFILGMLGLIGLKKRMRD